MEQSVVPAQYLQIALNLAERIAKGELPEGRRMYGRSIIASEYGVSPETVAGLPASCLTVTVSLIFPNVNVIFPVLF